MNQYINKHISYALVGCMVALLCFVSCRQEDDIYISRISSVRYTVAVVLPIGQNSEYKQRFEESIAWAAENLQKGERRLVSETGDTVAVELDFEWYDEDTENLSQLASELSRREDIFLMIGPMRNSNIDLMAPAFANEKKPMIVPHGCSEEIIRKYSVGTAGVRYKTPFLWSLCETDISQSEALLAKVWEKGYRTLALLTPDDVYGKTFNDWMPFQAQEMGLTMLSNEQYDDIGSLEAAARASFDSGAECVVCAARGAAETRRILELRRQYGNKAPQLFFTDTALSSALLDMGELAEGIEGVAQYADPATGFQIAYENHFKRIAAGVEAQVYDAVLLAGVAAMAHYYYTEEDVNSLLCRLTSMEGEAFPAWNEMCMYSYLKYLYAGAEPSLWGAGGWLTFDREAYTSVLTSAYTHWMVYDGQLVCLDYMSTDGGKRTSASLASWNWQARQQQQLQNQDVAISYAPLSDCWAVLVQGSAEWKNYRHQADVLNVYAALRQQGYEDDHIILILSDDIAGNDRNLYKGEVRTHTDGTDLYEGAVVDYATDTLRAEDIAHILLGEKSEHLPTVLETTKHSNVLFFWSGHGISSGAGREAGFAWRSDSQYFTAPMLRSAFVGLAEQERFRKLLAFFEPCFSQTMAEQAEGIPGILCLSSSASNEQSFADYYSIELGTWMSDRFSNNIVRTFQKTPDATFRELYNGLVTHTLGSHVHVANASCFGNLYTSSIAEFIQYHK